MHELIDQYDAQAGLLKQEIAGLTREQLLAHPLPGTWSIQQIVVHLADCEAVFADRIKRVVAEDRPALLAFDENRWMESLAVKSRPADESAAVVELVRKQVVTILRELPPAAARRVGVHSQAGELTLAALVEKAVRHFDHHLGFLRRKKALVQSR